MASPQTKFVITAEDKTKRAFQSVKGNLAGLNKNVATLGKSLAAVGAGAALTNLIGNAQRTIQSVDNLSVRINASATALSEYKIAAEQTGIQFESFGTAMQRLVTRMGEAQRGSTELQRAFSDLGLDINELSLLSADEAFDRVAEAIQGVGNQAQKQALTVKLLDTEGVRLLQTFGEISDARQLARDTGAFITQEEIDSSDRLNTSITTLKAEADSLGQTLVVVLEPALSGVFKIIGAGINVVEFFAKLLGSVGVGVVTLASALTVLDSKSPTEAFNKLTLVLRTSNEWLDRIWESTDAAAGKMQELGEAIPKADKFGAFIQGLKNQNEILGLQASGNELVAQKVMAVQRAEALLGVQRFQLSDQQRQIIGEQIEQQEQLKAKIKELAKAAKETASQMSIFAEQAARNMQDSFAEFLFDPFKEDGLKGMLNGFVDTLRQMAAQAAAAKIFDALGAGLSGQGGFLGAIGGFISPTKLAGGGRLVAGQPAIVGEAGRELFIPDRAGTIIPNDQMSGFAGLTVNVAMPEGGANTQSPAQFGFEVARALRIASGRNG